MQCLGRTDAYVYSHLDEPGIDQQPDTVDPAGANPECVTSDGVYDLMGNLHEWIMDGVIPPEDNSAVDFRGGYYADTAQNGDGCNYRTNAHSFTYYDYSTGFRCCATPF
jgi:formylglycine-generating enzyme required for sulfatase activity